MEARAYLRGVRISPRKVQIVLDLIRNKPTNVALAILRNTPKAASEPVAKLLKSAMANAENNHSMDKNHLYDHEAHHAPRAGQSVPHQQENCPHHHRGEGTGITERGG